MGNASVTAELTITAQGACCCDGFVSQLMRLMSTDCAANMIGPECADNATLVTNDSISDEIPVCLLMSSRVFMLLVTYMRVCL